MKIATYNVNGVNGRLPVLLRWLEEAEPDIVCLQELKSPDERFPVSALEAAGCGATWHGQKSWNGVAILARGTVPIETRRGLPGDPDDLHSRYIEAAVQGMIIGCLYLPNGNPAPGVKFGYKLKWFSRFATHAQEMLASDLPVLLAGDYNVIPTELDVHKPERWVDDALFLPEVREAYRQIVEQAGQTRCAKFTQASTRRSRPVHGRIEMMAWARESWLRPVADTDLHHERYAKAMMKCQNVGGFCAADGYCHFDGDCFKTAEPKVEVRIEELERELAELKALRS